MTSDSTTRRRYLAAAGAALTATVAGCQSLSGPSDANGTANATARNDTAAPNATAPNGSSGPTNADDLPPDGNPTDGYAPQFDGVPPEPTVDPSSFPTVSRTPTNRTYEIPLVPLDVAYALYARREARFVDTRPKTGFDVSHALGAVRSPSPDGVPNDPTGGWDHGDTVIAYCQCPTYLATERAAYLREAGFETVYALAGGYQGWLVANYPTDGSGVPAGATSWTLTGTTDPGDAGGVAYVFHDATGQVAATTVGSDGRYSMRFSFADASGSDAATVGTPSYRVDGPLRSLTSETVTADVAGGNATANGTANATGFGGANDSTDNGSGGSGSFGRLRRLFERA